ncbi:unnamed protein product [Protopolystoma xenopodis]|uniref:Dynein heavy chain C-terminal domain-containing protein n=1 Tax=Protopolystoma xenopodis TaxID=117903 RepID=A0A3S5CU15_9PLAT|nr:unnamed protein product [Protopolystoma xenopodis]
MLETILAFRPNDPDSVSSDISEASGREVGLAAGQEVKRDIGGGGSGSGAGGSSASAAAPLLEKQPTTRENTVAGLCRDMLARFPLAYSPTTVAERLDLMGRVQPMTIFLRQEVDRMDHVIREVTSTLQDLLLAIEGTVVMNQNLRVAMDALFDARAPANWIRPAQPLFSRRSLGALRGPKDAEFHLIRLALQMLKIFNRFILHKHTHTLTHTRASSCLSGPHRTSAHWRPPSFHELLHLFIYFTTSSLLTAFRDWRSLWAWRRRHLFIGCLELDSVFGLRKGQRPKSQTYANYDLGLTPSSGLVANREDVEGRFTAHMLWHTCLGNAKPHQKEAYKEKSEKGCYLNDPSPESG